MSLRALSVSACALALVMACTPPPSPRVATFRARPDDVVAGRLDGPFTGRVVDAANQTPVTGALVYASWSYQRGYGLAVAAGTREAVVSTDATGTYTVPKAVAPPAGARLTDFRLVIYKRGFVAYRSDRRFADFGARRDFAQRDNLVELERWRPDHSHARHLRFVGGGSVISAVTGWEADLAITEQTEPAAIPPAGAGDGPNLVAAQLLTENDIKSRTDYDGRFETGPLGDEPDTGSYSSQQFKALSRGESWDVAVRMWRLGPAAAVDRYDELRSGLPDVDERDEIGSRSLRAIEADIYGVAFLDGQRGLVVLITCGKSQCSSTEDVAVLGKIIHGRIKALWPLGAATGGAP